MIKYVCVTHREQRTLRPWFTQLCFQQLFLINPLYKRHHTADEGRSKIPAEISGLLSSWSAECLIPEVEEMESIERAHETLIHLKETPQ